MSKLTKDDNIGQRLKVCEHFNSIVMKLIHCAELSLQDKDPELYILKDRIKTAKNIDPTIIIEKCKRGIWANHALIENGDYEALLQIANIEMKELPFLPELLKKIYPKLVESEKRIIFNDIKQLLADVVEYKILTNDHQ